MKRPKRLSAAFVRTVNRPGRFGEGHGGFGLSLLVKERKGGGLAKSWSQRLRINGKPSNLGLGRYPIVTLAEARTKALENARAVDQGRDPRDRSRIPTFEQAAEKVIRLYEPTWRAGGADSSAKVWRSSLERYVYPKLGRKPVSEITTADVLGCDRADLAHQDGHGAPREGSHLVDHEMGHRAELHREQPGQRRRGGGAATGHNPATASSGPTT